MATEIATTESALLGVIESASKSADVDLDKMQRLLDMQERIMNKNAEMSFNEAMTKAQNEMPVIPRSTKAHNSKYANYEDIDKVARPIYSKHGFSVSYDTKEGNNGLTIYSAKVRHVSGHTEIYEREFTADTSGSKNAIQAKASAETYAKRYLLQGIFNIVTCDEDDDGNMARVVKISEEQVEILRDMAKEGGADIERFATYMGVKKIEDIPSSDFNAAKVSLKAKIDEASK